MHILHVIDALGLGGAERMLVDIANATIRRGPSVSVCITRQESALAGALDERIPLYVLGRRRRFAPAAGLRLARIVRRERVDVLHAHSRSTFYMLALLKSLRLVRRPILMHDHFGGIEIDTSIPRFFRHAGRRFVGHYVGVSERLGQWALRAGVPPGRISVVPNALQLARVQETTAVCLRAELGISAGTRVGIAVGNVRHEKGTDLLLDAIARCRTARPFALLVVGADADGAFGARCRARASGGDLTRRVRFLGPRTDIPGLLQGADFAVSAARSESGPLVLIEYLAAGLPVVATSAGDIGAQLAAGGVEGIVAAGDVPALTAELERVVDASPVELASRARRARETATRDYHIDGVIERWLGLYRDLVAGSSGWETAAGPPPRPAREPPP